MEGSKTKILIVDDEKHIRESLAMLLKRYYDEIVTAANGMEGLRALAEGGVSCVLSDINMPVMDGITFIKKAREGKNNVPFIFFTGYGNEKFMLDALTYGAFDFIDKPNFDNLEEIVKRGVESGYVHALGGELLSEYEKLLLSGDEEK